MDYRIEKYGLPHIAAHSDCNNGVNELVCVTKNVSAENHGKENLARIRTDHSILL